jgi:hypothetical protein
VKGIIVEASQLITPEERYIIDNLLFAQERERCEAHPKLWYPTIRRYAQQRGWKAKRMRRNHLWYFYDDSAVALRSPMEGLTDEAALSLAIGADRNHPGRWHDYPIEDATPEKVNWTETGL